MSRVRVFFEQRLVGMIEVDKRGPSFTYDRDWIELGGFPISTTMPLQAKRVSPDTFLPWMANLLPENEQLRTLGQLLGMAREDVVGLLSAIGVTPRVASRSDSPAEPLQFNGDRWPTRKTSRGSLKNCLISRSLSETMASRCRSLARRRSLPSLSTKRAASASR